MAADGVLWFGTRGGVSRFDGETWTSYTTADGLVHDNVSVVEVAPDGRIGTSNEAGGPVRLGFDGPGMLVIMPRAALEPVLAALGGPGHVPWR